MICPKCIDPQFNPGFHYNSKSRKPEILGEIYEMAEILHESKVGEKNSVCFFYYDTCDYHFRMAQQLHVLRFGLK